MHGVSQQDYRRVIVGVDYDRCTGVARMPVGIRTKEIAGIGCVGLHTSQPGERPRSAVARGTVRMVFTPCGLRMRCPFHSPPFCRAAQSMAISSAQENTPALPLMPPLRMRASGSCTCPQRTCPSGCFSVGAMFSGRGTVFIHLPFLSRRQGDNRYASYPVRRRRFHGQSRARIVR